MVFSSPVFLFVFLPLVFLLYKVAPGKTKNVILIFFSLLFYAWGEPFYVLLMLLSVAVNYGISLALGSTQFLKHRRERHLVLVVALVFNIGMLFVFKYANFFVDNLNLLLQLNINVSVIRLPIGISFFTF